MNLRRALIGLLAVPLLTVPVTAQDSSPPPREYGPGTTHFGGSPPLEYMGDAVALTFFVMDVTPYCGRADPGYVIMGCSTVTKDGTPVVVLRNPCPYTDTDAYARLACHEIAHLRGWPANHPPSRLQQVTEAQS